MKLKLVIGLVFLAPVLAFVLQNDQMVEMQLFRWHYAAALSLTVLSALLVGIILGLLVAPSRKLRKSRLEKRSQKEEKKQAQKPAQAAPAEPTSQEPVIQPVPEASVVAPVDSDQEFPPQP